MPPTLASPHAPLGLETVPAALPYLDFPFNFVARPLPAAASASPAAQEQGLGPAWVPEPCVAVPPRPAPVAPETSLGAGQLQLCRCRLRLFRLPVEGGAIEYSVLITELPQGERSDRLANPGRTAMECLAELLPEIKSTFLPKVPDEQITWFYHRRAVVSPQRPRRHDEVYRVVRCRPIAAEPMPPMLLDATLEEFDLAAGGMVEL